jgi:phosphatidylserine/phosphatidylglycerophosphate/cardiolipin synthase-like enzyme
MDFALPLAPHAFELIAGRGHYERVVVEVLNARSSVWIATANLKELWVEHTQAALGRRKRFRSVLAAFDELAERGVELRILHAGFPSRAFREAFDQHERLLRGGLELRMCPRVHLKTVIVDGRLLYLGSANWTGAGLGAKGADKRNFELGILTQDEAVLDQVQAFYEALWRGEPCASCRLFDQCEAPLSLPVAEAKSVRRSVPR